MNVEREFKTAIAQLERYSKNNKTLRGGGQDLRSRQLSEIRTICRLLGISTIHGNHDHILNENFTNAREYVWKYRKELAKIFDYTDSDADQDRAFNRLLGVWGFATIKVTHQKWVGAGKCPFTKRDTTVEKFRKFRMENPEFEEFISTQETTSVTSRKKVIEECQKRWRLSRKRRKMSYGYKISVSVGNLFSEAFSPASWNSCLSTATKQNTQKSLSLNVKLKYKHMFALKMKQAIPGALPLINVMPEALGGDIVTVHGFPFVSVECGGAGDCFFKAISRGLAERNIIRTHQELRQMLGEWLEVEDNAARF